MDNKNSERIVKDIILKREEGNKYLFIKKTHLLRIILLLVFAFIIIHTSFNYYKIHSYMHHSNTIARVQFSGLKYLFHAPYEYYAISESGACKIPEKIVMKQIGTNIKERDTNHYEDYQSWFISLYMVKSTSESKYKESNENFIENTYGDQYRLTYDSISDKDMQSNSI